MDAEPLYCAEQIKVPAQLPEIMKAWTKEVIRANPANIAEFSARYGGSGGHRATALFPFFPPFVPSSRQRVPFVSLR